MRSAAALGLAFVVAACRSGGSSGHDSDARPSVDAAAPPCTLPYPAGPYGTTLEATLRDYSWPGLLADGTQGMVALHDHLDACATAASLIAVRIGASWCGTCRWHASHSKVLAASDVGSRVQLLDVLVRGAYNAPAADADLAAWRALQDQPVDVGLDPDFTLEELFPPQTPLPLVLLVDAKTMKLVDVLSMPTEDALENHARTALAALDATTAKPDPTPTLVDGRFTRDEWDLVAAMTLSDPPPPDTTNSVADVLGVGELGRVLFTNAALSPSTMVSCGSCHQAPRQLTDGRPTSPEGLGLVPRNSPSLVLAAYQPFQFWDGRADTLWSQALMPIENPNEFGSSRLFVAHLVFSIYRTAYEQFFGPMPDLSDLQRFPASGLPGDPNWESMTSADQDAVTRVFVNVGKAIEAYERSLRGTPIPISAYAAGDTAALMDDEKDGLLAYLQAGCAQCHWGSRLTDDAFHVLRFPTGRADRAPDRGLIDGIPQYMANVFSAGSIYSDDPSQAHPPPAAGPWTLGAFKTPSLRNVVQTPPYGHGGNYLYLNDVVELHRTSGLPAGSPLTTGDADPWLPSFEASMDMPIVNFLNTLTMVFAR